MVLEDMHSTGLNLICLFVLFFELQLWATVIQCCLVEECEGENELYLLSQDQVLSPTRNFEKIQIDSKLLK